MSIPPEPSAEEIADFRRFIEGPFSKLPEDTLRSALSYADAYDRAGGCDGDRYAVALLRLQYQWYDPPPLA